MLLLFDSYVVRRAIFSLIDRLTFLFAICHSHKHFKPTESMNRRILICMYAWPCEIFVLMLTLLRQRVTVTQSCLQRLYSLAVFKMLFEGFQQISQATISMPTLETCIDTFNPVTQQSSESVAHFLPVSQYTDFLPCLELVRNSSSTSNLKKNLKSIKHQKSWNTM